MSRFQIGTSFSFEAGHSYSFQNTDENRYLRKKNKISVEIFKCFETFGTQKRKKAVWYSYNA